MKPSHRPQRAHRAALRLAAMAVAATSFCAMLACASSAYAQYYTSRSGTLICAPNGVCRPAPIRPLPQTNAAPPARSKAGSPAPPPSALSNPDGPREPESGGNEGCTKFSPGVQKAAAAAIADLRARKDVKNITPREVNAALVHGTVSRFGKAQYNVPENPPGFLDGGYREPWPGASQLALSLIALDNDHTTLRACFPDFVKLANEVKGHIEARKQEAEKRQREQERLMQTPTYVLGNSYIAFINVKRCWKHRLGYASVYISDAEMEQANIAIKRIEQKMKDGLEGNWTTDSMWQEADRRSQTNLRLDYRDGGGYQRDVCQRELGRLLDEYKKQFPGDFATPKDF